LAVHEDESVGVFATLDALTHLVKRVLTVISNIDYLLNVVKLTLFEDDLHPKCVEWLIIDDKDSFL
jgi:hypothetical protein